LVPSPHWGEGQGEGALFIDRHPFYRIGQ